MGPTGRLVTIKRSGLDGAHFPLSLSTCWFGRGIECDIRIQLPVVSKQHCKIEVDDDQKAVLFNFSTTNPTQLNGSVIQGPVQLRHGDVITIIDRSFRYENDGPQHGGKSTEFPGQRREQASPLSQLSRSGFSSSRDGKVQDHPNAARSHVTEEGGSGGPLERRGHVGVTRTPSRGSEGPTTGGTADVGSSEPLGKNCRGDAMWFGAGARVTVASGTRGQGLEQDGENESPFRKLYESLKEELDAKAEKEAVAQNRRKSGSRGPWAADPEPAGGSQGAAQPGLSPQARRRSGRSSQTGAASTGQGPGQTPEAPVSPSVPPTATAKAKTPARGSQPDSAQKRRSGDPSVTPGGAPVRLPPREDLGPRRLSARQPTPADGVSGPGSPADTVFARKRRRSPSPRASGLATGADPPPHTLLSPLLGPAEPKVAGKARGSSPEQQAPAATAGSPGLGAVDVSNVGDSLNKTEGKPLKRRRVSFGGHLRPELFDENLPPNTPLKRGETPARRRSLAAHTPPVLKKIIKEQPRPSEKGESSEIRLEVTTLNMFASPPPPPAHGPTETSPLANEGRRRSPKPPASSGGRPTHPTDAPKRGGRRSSGGGPARRASGDRGQQGILQAIHSRRRSGASEANLLVSRSWADVVKLCARQTQTKVVRHGVVRHGPPRPPSKRQRRINTPKKPLASVHHEFSTGHAASPCTIVIGKAHLEKVSVPARPYRMLNHFVIPKKIDFSEDLSGLTEMFKTPAKERPQTMNRDPVTFSDSEDLLTRKFQVLDSEDQPQLCTPKKLGENVFPRAQNAPEEPWDEQSSNPALTPQCVTVNGNLKTSRPETAPPKAAASTNKSRRSRELRNTQVASAACEKDGREVDTVQNIVGRCLRKSPVQTQPPEGEMKERSSETCKNNIEPKENSEKLISGRRSRRSSELKCTPRTSLIPIQRLQETESKEELEGIRSFLQNPSPAEEPVDVETKTTLMHRKSPAPVSTPTKANARAKTPSQRENVDGLSDLRKPTRTPGDTTDAQKEPAAGAKSMKELKGAPEQKLVSSENVTRSRRRSRTPKRKAQTMEDLVGFKELFQTPGHIETVTDDKTTKTPCKSPKPEPVSTPTSTKRRFRTPLGKVHMEEELSAHRKPTPRPGEATRAGRTPINDDKDVKAFKETQKQDLDSAENIIGSRRSRTPRRKIQPIEDLAGFKELFQTPVHIAETVTDDEITKTPCKSPKPEPVSTPTSTKRRSRTPLGRVDVQEALLALREATPRPATTTHSHREPEGDGKSAEFSQETPEQKVDSAKYVTGSRRRSRTPRREVQPMADLAGFEELFQTPIHITETVTDDEITKTPCNSPKSEPVSTPTSSKRRSRTPLGKVDVQEALSALRKSTPRPGATTHMHREPEGDDESAQFFKETPTQEPDSAEPVTRSRRRSRTPKRKIPHMQDLVGFKELFQTPAHIETVTDNKTTKTPCKSRKSEPVSTPTSTKRRFRTPLGRVDVQEALWALRETTPRPGATTHPHREPEGDDKSTELFMETPTQELDSAEPVTRSRRRSRTPRRKVQPIEDLAGFKELFQTPIHLAETVTDDEITKTPCNSPKPDPVSTPTSTKRRSRTPLGRVDVQEALSALRKPTPRPGATTHSHREPEGDDRDVNAFKETPKQKLDSTENVNGRRRRSRTPGRNIQPIEDLAGFKELFQTPVHMAETVTDDKPKTPCTSPQPESATTSTSMTRWLRTPVGKVDVEEELSALRKPTPGETTHLHREPEGDGKGITASKEPPEQKMDSAENVTGGRRRSRSPRRKVQPIEDLAGFKELFQTPVHITETVTDDEITKTPCKPPKPEPVSTPTSSKRRSRTPLGRVDVQEALLALREATPRPGLTTHSHREPEGDNKSTELFMETPTQEPDSAENVTGSRREVQPIEDLAGFKELFQTPIHFAETVTDDEITKTPCNSPKSDPVSTPTSTKRRFRTPLGRVDVQEALSALRKSTPRAAATTHSHREPEGDNKSAEFFQETPEQKLDSAKYVIGSRRRSRTPGRKIQPMEDLAGFKELFQTPGHIETVTDDKTTKTPCKSPKSEPVSTPTSTKRCSRTPVGKVDVQEALSALREATPRPAATTHSHREPEGGVESAQFFKEILNQELDSAEPVTGSRRRSRTPRRKIQPIEDLADFKELFQTPIHFAETVTDDKTKTPRTSPQPESATTSTSMTRRLRTPVEKVDVEEELLALRKSTPGATTLSHREPEGDDKGITASKEPPEQKPDSAENVTGGGRRSRTPRRKVQPIEDLAGFKELFQTPVHMAETVTDDEITKTPCKSPKSDPVSTPTSSKRCSRTPLGKVDVQEALSALKEATPRPGATTHSHREPEGDDESAQFFQETPTQKLDSAEPVTGSRRRSRTPRREVQPIEDLAGFKELFQTPIHITETVTDDKTTKTPCKSPNPEPVLMPRGRGRRVKAPQGQVVVEDELSALGRSTRTLGNTTRSRRAPEAADEDSKAFVEIPEEKSGPAGNGTGSKRRPRTRKEKAQPLDNAAGLEDEPATVAQTTELPSQSPPPEAAMPKTRGKRQVRAPPRKVDVEEEPSAPRKSTRTSVKTTRSRRAPEAAEEDTKLLEAVPEEKSDPAGNVTASKRPPRAGKAKAQPLEDLAGRKEPLQICHPEEPGTVAKSTELPPKSPPPEAGVPTTRRKRQVRAPAGKVDVEEEPSAPRKSTRTSVKTTRSRRAPEAAEEDIKLLEAIPEEKSDPAGNVTASKRRPRAGKAEAQPLEESAGLKDEPETVAQTTELPSQSPPPEAVLPTTRGKRHVRVPPGKVDAEDELTAPRKSTRTSVKATRFRRAPEAAEEDVKLLEAILEEKSDPAGNVTASKRRPRAGKAKAQPLEDLAGLEDQPETVAQTTELPSQPPPPEAAMPTTRGKRQVRAPPGKVDVEDEPSAPRTSGRTTRSRREPVDITVFAEPPGRKRGPVANTEGSKRQPRSRKERAQPPEGPAGCQPPSPSPVPDEELDLGAESVWPAPAPGQNKPAKPRRVLWAPDVKPEEDQGGSRDPVQPQLGSGPSPPPKRKREERSPTGKRRGRPSTRAQDPAEERPPPKRQQTAPQDRPEPLGAKKRRGALADSPGDVPSQDLDAKKRGRRAPVATSPGKEPSLRSRLPGQTRRAEQTPAVLTAAEKAEAKRSGRKPGAATREVKGHAPEDGDQGQESRADPRPGRRGKAAEEKAVETRVGSRGKAQEEAEVARHAGLAHGRSRKATVPPAGDTAETQSKPRATWSAKRPSGETRQEEEDDAGIKRTRTRSLRGRDGV